MTLHACSKNLDHPPATVITRSQPGFEDAPPTNADLEAINRFAAVPLRPEQVYVRSMYLCSSQPCSSDGCQFTRGALEEIAERIVGQSVLTGHDRSGLPLARFFKAAVVERGSGEDGEPLLFVRAWFYWLRDTSGAKDLLLNIDGGIYREVSLAWKYDSWRCSICHAANGACGHRPGERYGSRTCYRLIDHVTEVLEGSLVYKSADRDTFLAGARIAPPDPRDEHLLLVCGSDDPLLAWLREAGLVEESHRAEEWLEPLAGSADILWVRGHSKTEAERIARQTLFPGGCCLAEILQPAGNELDHPVETWIFTRDASHRITLTGLAEREV
ncbi:MAG: hypothetical protein ACE15F_13620 [bacterium]